MADVIRLSIEGALPGGEVWSINPCWSVEPPGIAVDFDDCQAIATAAAAIDPGAAVKGAMNSATTITSVRVEARTYAGVLEALAEAPLATPLVGGGTSPKSFQSAWVVSLRTTTPGGRGRGRLYWPATAQNTDSSTLRVPTAARDSFAAGFKTYLSGLETAVRATIALSRLVVWSRTGVTAHGVSSIQVGDILDVQRRRRDTLTEAYKTVAYP